MWSRELGSRFSLSSTASTLYMTELEKFKKSFPTIQKEQWGALNELCLLVEEWNTKVNVISRKDIKFLVENHLLPSLSLCNVYSFGSDARIVDVGSGGGFPGLPLSIVHPTASFTLIDSNGKKSTVVQDIVSKLGLKNVKVVHKRAEEYQEEHDFILGRAVAAIPAFLSFSSHLLAKTSIHEKSGLFYIKGGDFGAELQEAKISQHQLFPVNELVPITTDKFVLHILASEVHAFNDRHRAASSEVITKVKRVGKSKQPSWVRSKPK